MATSNPARDLGEDAKTEFFRTAIHYYIAGRFSALSQLFPLCATLLHYAVEMFLKGALSPNIPLGELRKYNHNLSKLWEKFKTDFPDPTLAQFNTVVSRLHQFERFRYPDAVLRNGMKCQFALCRRDLVHPQNTGPNLVLEDVDHFIKVIFGKAKMNPSVFLVNINNQAKPFLSLHNVHPL